MTTKRWLALFLGLLSLVLVLGEVIRNWKWHEQINPWVISIGAVFAFLAGWMLDAKGAEDAAAFIVKQGTSVVVAVRGGRRSTDPIVAVPVDAAVADPSSTSPAEGKAPAPSIPVAKALDARYGDGGGVPQRPGGE